MTVRLVHAAVEIHCDHTRLLIEWLVTCLVGWVSDWLLVNWFLIGCLDGWVLVCSLVD